MGEAKRRRQNAVPTVYHHTSTLRTNLIWMSGVIEVEGKSEGAFHPQLGEIKTDARLRRELKNFPPLAWFTKSIAVPNCLTQFACLVIDQKTGEQRELKLDSDMANAVTLNRVALGFPTADIPVVPWPDYYGYATHEGEELNDWARAAGDDPDEWYVSETPIDLLKMSQLWLSRSISQPKLTRNDQSIAEIHRMVAFCRENEDAYIAPTWFRPEAVQAPAPRLRGRARHRTAGARACYRFLGESVGGERAALM